MNWINIDTTEVIEEIVKKSFSKPQLIFKHSTTCSISQMAKGRLDREDATNENIDFHYLDLLRLRPISNFIAEKFSVHHESPQVLLIKNGECIYDESHMGIRFDEIVEQANN